MAKNFGIQDVDNGLFFGWEGSDRQICMMISLRILQAIPSAVMEVYYSEDTVRFLAKP